MKGIVYTCQKIVHICNRRKKSSHADLAQNRYLQVAGDISLHRKQCLVSQMPLCSPGRGRRRTGRRGPSSRRRWQDNTQWSNSFSGSLCYQAARTSSARIMVTRDVRGPRVGKWLKMCCLCEPFISRSSGVNPELVCGRHSVCYRSLLMSISRIYLDKRFLEISLDT